MFTSHFWVPLSLYPLKEHQILKTLVTFFLFDLMWHSEEIQDIFHLFFCTFEFHIDAFKVLVAESALLRWNHEPFDVMQELHYSQLCHLVPGNAIRIHQNKQNSPKIYFLSKNNRNSSGKGKGSLKRMQNISGEIEWE